MSGDVAGRAGTGGCKTRDDDAAAKRNAAHLHHLSLLTPCMVCARPCPRCGLCGYRLPLALRARWFIMHFLKQPTFAKSHHTISQTQ